MTYQNNEESPALPRGFLRDDDNPANRFYIAPLGAARGGKLLFDRCRLLVRADGVVRSFVATPDDILDWAWSEGEDAGAHAARVMARLKAPLRTLSGLPAGRPAVMGVVNVTPDSFSDGGDFVDPAVAIAHGHALVEAGADILDIGGESTRPGAKPVTVAEELQRVVSVIEGLNGCGARISIDTRHAGVMAAALEAGADIINDVTALRGDPESLGVAVRSGAPVILMHMQGEPGTMQAAPKYDDVLADVYDFLNGAVVTCEAAGIPRDRIAVDPGIGFGKTVKDNLELLSGLSVFGGLGCPVLIGVSRKSMIAALSRDEAPKDRLAGSLAAAMAALERGARILRVHDVAETRQAVAVWQAIADI
ncbi:MAG: dihydropteroate synthase [Rhodospirillales bacterium]|nr:dihydropteroate synthase [Rhodospirillales bacterium]MCW8951545.1 dihydropteroate synthase [Rhodospirillales bacterium]